MEACAENRKQLVITDRPNPCDYVDGPVRQKNQKSFVGMHAIPILHGCTVGELAQMINGEGWLPNGKKCALTVIPVEGWKHGQPYSLPVKPSPNLPNDQAIAVLLVPRNQVGKEKRIGSLSTIFRKNTDEKEVNDVGLVLFDGSQHVEPAERQQSATAALSQGMSQRRHGDSHTDELMLSVRPILDAGDDLWEYSKINDGWDPEASRKVSAAGRFPFVRTVTFGLNLTF
jgi:hypothetical protein